MSIKEVGQKIKQGSEKALSRDSFFLFSVIMLLIGAIAGGISLSRSLEHPPISFGQFDVETGALLAENDASSTALRPYPTDEELSRLPGAVFVSKNGTKAYYPDCPGAARVFPKNRIWFSDSGSASVLGYPLAPKCK